MTSMKLLLAPALLLSLSGFGFAQSDMHAHQAADTLAAKSDAQKSFESLKGLAGTWKAKLTTNPPVPEMDDNVPTEISLRVTSRGNAIVHEMYSAGKVDDGIRYDHPVTMLYVDEDRLNLVHYCDAGNRPHMVARTSPDGRTVEFDFVEMSGGNQHGHMQHVVFTILDANHHTEDWTYMMPGDKPMHAHFELERIAARNGHSGM
jgi:hypothetical protein